MWEESLKMSWKISKTLTTWVISLCDYIQKLILTGSTEWDNINNNKPLFLIQKPNVMRFTDKNERNWKSAVIPKTTRKLN